MNADIKALDNRGKNAAKMETKGKAYFAKGKKSKKTAQSALNKSQAAFDAATEKYSATEVTNE